MCYCYQIHFSFHIRLIEAWKETIHVINATLWVDILIIVRFFNKTMQTISIIIILRTKINLNRIRSIKYWRWLQGDKCSIKLIIIIWNLICVDKYLLNILTWVVYTYLLRRIFFHKIKFDFNKTIEILTLWDVKANIISNRIFQYISTSFHRHILVE